MIPALFPIDEEVFIEHFRPVPNHLNGNRTRLGFDFSYRKHTAKISVSAVKSIFHTR